MAYKIDKNGMLIGDGLPDGVTINMDAYNSALSKYTASKTGNLFYESTRSPEVKLADSVTKFKIGLDGKIYAFLPELEKKSIGMQSIIGGGDKWQERKGTSIGDINRDFGTWIEASGIALDEASKSGQTGGEFTFRNEGGAPLAVFGNDRGYMRLATNAPKTADNIRLGNNSGTTSNVRQNAQRRTLL